MWWLNFLSFLIGLYFRLGFLIETICIDVLILFYGFFPKTSKKYFRDSVDDALRRSGYEDVLHIAYGKKYLLGLFVLKYGFNEIMLKKLTEYLDEKIVFSTGDGKIFSYEKRVEDDLITYSAHLDDEPFEFCAGDIMF
jgi:hypothetical protein